MSDDTSDISEHVRHVIVFRYEVEGSVHKRFWGFFNLKAQNAERLADCIFEQLSVVLNGDSNKVIAQTYDGAAVMSGKKGAHTIIKQSYQYAHFVHCYAHQLNLIMEKALSQNPQAHIFSVILLQHLRFLLSHPHD